MSVILTPSIAFEKEWMLQCLALKIIKPAHLLLFWLQLSANHTTKPH
jgi:hypothetical protein